MLSCPFNTIHQISARNIWLNITNFRSQTHTSKGNIIIRIMEISTIRSQTINLVATHYIWYMRVTQSDKQI